MKSADYNEALRLLNEFEINDDIPRIMQSMYYTTMADMFIRRKDYRKQLNLFLKLSTL